MHRRSPLANPRWLKRCMNVLLIHDEAIARDMLRSALESLGHRVRDAPDIEQARVQIARDRFDVVFTAISDHRPFAPETVSALHNSAPDTQVVVIVDSSALDMAIDAVRHGAAEYCVAPCMPGRVQVVLDRLVGLRRLKFQLAQVQEQLSSLVPEAEFQSHEPAMQQVLAAALRTAETPATILLRGEIGVGKQALARLIHARSPRSDAPFLIVRCAAASPETLEKELFGPDFDSSTSPPGGKLAGAEGGTLFFDEISGLPSSLQARLLRLLQEHQLGPGNQNSRLSGGHSGIRFVAATSRDVQAEAASGAFRADLLYHLSVIELIIPPLRQRTADILPLATHFLRFFAGASGKPVSAFHGEACSALVRHSWPGNVSELRNAVERGVMLSTGAAVDLADLPAQMGPDLPRSSLEVGGPMTLEQLESEHIRRVVAAAPTIEKAAQLLGIDPSTLYRKRKRYGS